MSVRDTNQETSDLVAGVRSGDQAAFATLTEPYRRQLHLHCYRMLGSFEEAEDVVQETLLRAWRGRAGFEGRSMVRTWLYRIATNACLDHLESRSRRLPSVESPQASESYAVDWLVVRNPWSAYAETKRRPVPLSLNHYMLGWTLNQQFALRFKAKFPSRFHILRFEDLVAGPRKSLGELCQKIGCDDSESLSVTSWNGVPLDEVFPWGTIRKPTPEANRATALTLSGIEQSEVRAHASLYLDALDYRQLP